MPAGKSASQAGHAFLDAFLTAPLEIASKYRTDRHGTKVVLVAEDEVALRQAYIQAQELGLPCALVIDSGHIMPPHFDGSPILTALGIGPVTREQAEPVTGSFMLMK